MIALRALYVEIARYVSGRAMESYTNTQQNRPHEGIHRYIQLGLVSVRQG